MKQLFLILFLLPTFVFSNVRELIGTYQGEVEQPPPPPDPTQNTITPPVGPLIAKNSYDWIIDTEFLYWFTSVTNLSYCQVTTLTPLGDSTNPASATLAQTKKEEFDWGWDPGVRIGTGVVTNHDGWDFYVDWTYYYNSIDAKVEVPNYSARVFSSTTYNPPGTKVLKSSWIYAPNLDHFNSMSADFSLLFNQIDLTLGRKFWISEKLSLHPFFGLRGYWSRMHFGVRGFRAFIPGANAIYQNEITSSSRFKQNGWSVGPLMGFDTAWHITPNWSLFAEGSVALTYGSCQVKQKIANVQIQSFTGGQTYNNESYATSDFFWKTQPFADLGMGVRWETIFEEKYRLLVDAGWESHFLFKFNELMRGINSNDVFKDLPSTVGSLTLSGIVLRGRFEF